MCTANGEFSELLSGQMSCGKGESKASESLSSHGPHCRQTGSEAAGCLSGVRADGIESS